MRYGFALLVVAAAILQAAARPLPPPKHTISPLERLLSISKHHQQLGGDAVANCPYQPSSLVQLPSPLPDSIQEALAGVDSVLNATINTATLPGIAASITYNGQTLYSRGFGVVDKDSTIAPNGSTIFRIGSVSKVFAVIMIYQLYMSDVISSLDNPFSMYCPVFSIGNPFNSEPITLREMMAQLSGLPREAPCSPQMENDLNLCPVSTDTILERLQFQYLVFPPWTEPSYSNLAYALLGRCVLQTLYPDVSYEDYINQTILAPLGMVNTGFTFTDRVISQLATGYDVNGSPVPLYDLGWVGPAGQMYSTTDDLNILAEWLFNANASLALPSLGDLATEMALPLFVNADQKTGFGTPWEVQFTSNYTILFKGGNVDGYSALFSYVPQLQLGINVLFTGGVDEFSIGVELNNLLVPALVGVLKEIQPLFPYPPDPQVYQGGYTEVSTNSTAQIVTYNDQLVISTPLGNYYLSYWEPLRFQVQYDPSLAPCQSTQLSAFRGQWVYFDPPNDVNGTSPGFAIPGLLNGYYWKHN